jgi:hypothetical protein
MLISITPLLHSPTRLPLADFVFRIIVFPLLIR